MHQYMHSELEAEEIFPPEYAQISTRMVQIKADIEKKEQSLKDEARKKSDLIAYLAIFEDAADLCAWISDSF